MELEHSFTVPVPLDRAWDVLLDVERVAPCMPGATLDSVERRRDHGPDQGQGRPDHHDLRGHGPLHRAGRRTPAWSRWRPSGKETRGAGTASATVRSELHGEGDETHVIVHTTLNVTGRPAQFGRGVMTEVERQADRHLRGQPGEHADSRQRRAEPGSGRRRRPGGSRPGGQPGRGPGAAGRGAASRPPVVQQPAPRRDSHGRRTGRPHGAAAARHRPHRPGVGRGDQAEARRAGAVAERWRGQHRRRRR